MSAGAFTAFVPGKLENHDNRKSHRMVTHRYRVEWHQRVTAAVVTATHAAGWATSSDYARAPKDVWLIAQVFNLFDSHDGLRSACKPVVDGLVKCRVLAGDDDATLARYVQTIRYAQTINRQQRGVRVEVILQ